ncbi:Zinc finger-containing ubiquitin peptidase 1 [Sesamum angolense]|uniref:Zinc finger-containing ubiquitin peptidase 1 n=1 Tax=Sesamum angolense TaxID=2727404 RepID=A0AAE2BZR4_9LAMI|nr:Zinc finger-containing ubiquitin peptidase 1 [Sesamum angolense]
MDFSTCPICNFSIPSPELERHVDEHFSDEDYARDFEFAQQIARTPPTLPRTGMSTHFLYSCSVLLRCCAGTERWSNGNMPNAFYVQAEDSSECKPSCGDDPQNSSSRCDARITAGVGNTCNERHASLFRFQSKESFYKVEGGLMTMLRKCLELESGNSTSILSGHVDHFQSTDTWDAGWGCGWRNIQMLSSHLIARRQEAREVLYGGSGFVPSIGSLQRWLELAWEKGFDAPGADEFDQKIYGKRNWIGTTECAALLRSFGLRARIVDFSSGDFELASSAPHLGLDTRELPQVYGPMDIFLSKGKLDLPPTVSSGNQSYKHSSVSSKDKGHQILTEPLYFQHDGHSRTIVGIQAKHQKNGKQQYNLLIFDPAEKTRALEKSLRENVGWQKLIKRGIHTLKKPQYQLCFIEPGIAHGEELEELKTLHSARHEF